MKLGALLPRRAVAGYQPVLLKRPAAATTGLRFTELLVLGALAIATLLSISMPLFGMQLHLTFLNHAPLLLMLPALALHLAGAQFNHERTPTAALMGHCAPLVLLAVFALAGSLIARFALDVKESYLSFGIYLLLLPLYAAVAPQQARAGPWARALMGLWLAASLLALAGEAARWQTKETLHEIEYLVVVGFFGLFVVARSGWVKALALALLLAAAVLNQKLTGYIVAALAVVVLIVQAGWRRTRPEWRWLYAAGAVAFTLLVAVALTVAYFEFRNVLPSGNADVRLKQYEQAWRQFVASPLWGNAYLESSGEAYREYTRVLNIPTHSDVLDLLKHGGLIAFGLFTWGYARIFLLLTRAVAATAQDRVLNSYFVTARFFQATALVTFAINPLLLKGPFLIVIWGHLGLAVGLALACTLPRPP